MAPQDVMDEYKRYVMNDVPIRMIYIPKMELVDRGFVRRHFEDRINKITEKDVSDGAKVSERVPVWKWGRLSRADNVEDHVKRVVKYAILSHRWLDEGEPTYQEVSNWGPAKAESADEIRDLGSGPGYKKLRQFCEEAKRRGMDFAWSDTCCIDKTSSAELDESIRSMFRWYRNSHICIVHLAQTIVIEDLKKDEWFQRGWTLQELLAPRNMKFFKHTWEPLTEQENDKGDPNAAIVKTIEAVTGIPFYTICAEFHPSPRWISRRMRWAAKRKTTRAEDIAYSLMGIFDVFLQVAYGEGGDRAFCRLIEAIMQAGGDSSVLHWAGKPADHWSSSALPSSPASYALGSPRIRDSTYSLDMALTSRGLRVSLVILPLDIVFPENYFMDSSIRLCCSHFEIGDLPNPQPGIIQGHRSPIQVSEQDYALGVTNYILPKGDANPAIPKTLMAYLLKRDKVKPGPLRTASIGVDYVGEAKGWTRVAEEFITVNLPQEIGKNHLPIDHSYVQRVYL